MIRKKSKKGKDVRFRATNIFKGVSAEELQLSHHFFERWKERVSDNKFESKEELEVYIKSIYNPKTTEFLDGDHYLIGDFYVTASKEENCILLITTLGRYEDNPIIYNMITSGELNKILRKYGKLDLSFAA